MQSKKYLLLLPLISLGLIGCSSNTTVSNDPTDPTDPETTTTTRYYVTYAEDELYTIEGISTNGYRAGSMVWFLVNMTYSVNQVESVAWNGNVIEPDVTGAYSFIMPEEDVVLTISYTTSFDALTITYVLPDGVSLTDDFLSLYSYVESGRVISLPTGDDSYLSYSGSNTVEGWATYNSSSDSYSLLTDGTYTVNSDVTLYAYTKDYRGDDVSEFNRDSGTNMIDYAGTATFNGDEVSSVGTSGSYSNYSYKQEYLVDGKLGGKLTYNGTLENYYTRFLSRPQGNRGSYYNLTNGTNYNISYTLVNFGTTDVTIQISQLPSNNNYTVANGGVLSSWYTIDANGGKAEFTLSYTETRTSPANLLTGFVVKGTCTDFAVGFQIALEVA